jgi:hypothetical protein
VLWALDLPAEPDAHLEALSVTLDDAYCQVASELVAANGQAVIHDGQIRLERLARAPEPPGLKQEREEMQRMMPRVDLPKPVRPAGLRDPPAKACRGFEHPLPTPSIPRGY